MTKQKIKAEKKAIEYIKKEYPGFKNLRIEWVAGYTMLVFSGSACITELSIKDFIN